ncbi:MAG: amino acid ABC transporter substrate-binding protein [Nitrososphaerota archaeon]|nr:amino acid ABC transporter substrate-binding protein [Nitrososphaerota archaeon]
MQRRTVFLAAVLVVVVGVVAAFVLLPGVISPGPRREAPKEIVVGAVLPMSGTHGRIGLYFKTAFELYFDEVNRAGGVYVKEFDKRIPLKLIVLDDESDPTKSATLLERLITVEKVNLILGGYSTPLVAAQAPVAERYKMPYVNPGGATSTIFLTEDGKRRYNYMFGMIASIKQLALTTMEMLKAEIDKGTLPKPLKIASVNENTDHGREYLAGLKEAVRKYPGYFEIVYEAFHTIGEKDYTAILSAIKASGANAMLNDMRLPDYITMHRQYAAMGLCHIVVSYGPRGPEGTAIRELGRAAENVFGVQWWNPSDPRPGVRDFNAKWDAWVKAKNLDLPSDWFGAVPYEAARLLVWAIERAGSIEPEKVHSVLLQLNSPEKGLSSPIIVGGSIYFDEKAGGQITNQFVVVQVQDGKPQIVWPRESVTSTFRPNKC